MLFAQEIIEPELSRYVVPAAVALAVLVALGIAFRMWRAARQSVSEIHQPGS